MSEKFCQTHHEKIVSFCIAQSCTLKPLCSLCIVQHLKEVHSQATFGEIELLPLESFLHKCVEKLEKSTPKYNSFIEELAVFSENFSSFSFDKLTERLKSLKDKIVETLNKCFYNQVKEYEDFYERQSQQIFERFGVLREKVANNLELFEKILVDTKERQLSNNDFSLLQKIYTESLDLEIEKRRNTLQKLKIEIEHINMQGIGIDGIVDSQMKVFSQNYNDFLSKVLVRSTANTSLIGINDGKSMNDIGAMLESVSLFSNKDMFKGLAFQDNIEKTNKTIKSNNNKSCSNLLVSKTEEDERYDDPNNNKRSHTPSIKNDINKTQKFSKKIQKQPMRIEEKIEEENANRNSIVEKKPINFNKNIKKSNNFSKYYSSSPPQKNNNNINKNEGISRKNLGISHKIIQKNEENTGKEIFPEKNFLNYLIFLKNVSFKKYRMLLFTQEFTRKIASMKTQESYNQQNIEIFNEFKTKYKEIANLKKNPLEILFIYQDYSKEYFIVGLPWDLTTSTKGYYLQFNDENQEKCEKFRYFINGLKILIGLFKGKSEENLSISLNEFRYEIGVGTNLDLIRLVICYHIQSKNEQGFRQELNVDDLLEFKKQFIG